jgi:hypothetical protein
VFSLHFRLEPNRTLATKRLAGKKMQKERLTIALTCNVDGSVKLPPFVIYKYQRPRAFTKRNIANPKNLGILWFHNKKAWMTTALFEKFLLDFERRMSLAGKRRVLLLVDNFAGHQYNNIRSELHITTVEFLPPNTTSYFQPMDAGVINSFKAQYRKLLIEHKLDKLMSNEDPEIDVYEAVKMLECAWRLKVTSNVIYHCWRHTGMLLLPDLNGVSIPNPQVELQELTRLLERLSLATNRSSDGMEAQEYVQYELDFDLNNPYEVTEEDVWNVLGSIGGTSNVSDDDCEGEECEVEPIPSYSDLQSSFGTIRRYMESRSCDVSKYVGLLVQIEKYLQVVHANESHQRTIDSYFTRDL